MIGSCLCNRGSYRRPVGQGKRHGLGRAIIGTGPSYVRGGGACCEGMQGRLFLLSAHRGRKFLLARRLSAAVVAVGRRRRFEQQPDRFHQEVHTTYGLLAG